MRLSWPTSTLPVNAVTIPPPRDMRARHPRPLCSRSPARAPSGAPPPSRRPASRTSHVSRDRSCPRDGPAWVRRARRARVIPQSSCADHWQRPSYWRSAARARRRGPPPADPRVGTTTADVAGQRLVDGASSGSGRGPGSGHGREDHSRSAVSALGGADVDERLLDRMQSAPGGEALDRGDVRPARVATGCWHARTGLPSTSTVQEPHTPSPQPGLAPVRPSSPAAPTAASVDRTDRGVPLTIRVTNGGGSIRCSGPPNSARTPPSTWLPSWSTTCVAS